MTSSPYAVILAGGGGTRFWPASRAGLPKQFLSLDGGAPLLAATRARLGERVPDERVLVVAGESQADLVRGTLPRLPKENLILEPVGRNTLPAVALAAAEIRRRDPDAVQVVLPADHVISPEHAFLASLEDGVTIARDEQRLVIFGIQPTFPATGYGYIEQGDLLPHSGDFDVHEVLAFVEKPNRSRAEEYLATGRFVWNSGMFIWSTAAIVAALEEHAPQVWNAIRDASSTQLADAYADLDSVPVDVGVMERAENRAVIGVDYTWSDVGTWKAVGDVTPADDDGNHLVGGGTLLTLDARGNVVWADPATLTALLGVENLVVVRAGDAVLVCPKARSEEVKKLMDSIPQSFQ